MQRSYCTIEDAGPRVMKFFYRRPFAAMLPQVAHNALTRRPKHYQRWMLSRSPRELFLDPLFVRREEEHECARKLALSELDPQV
jgi:hypothetical protein